MTNANNPPTPPPGLPQLVHGHMYQYKGLLFLAWQNAEPGIPLDAPKWFLARINTYDLKFAEVIPGNLLSYSLIEGDWFQVYVDAAGEMRALIVGPELAGLVEVAESHEDYRWRDLMAEVDLT